MRIVSKRLFVRPLCLLALFVSTAAAQTVVLYNVPNNASSSDLGQTAFCASFSTQSSAVNLTDVAVDLMIDPLNNSNGTGPNPFTTVTLRSDSSTRPGSILATLGTEPDSAITTTQGVDVTGTVADFPVGPPIHLNASTRYWICLATSAGSKAGWVFTGNNASSQNEFVDTIGQPSVSNSFGDGFAQSFKVTGTVAAGPPAAPAPPTLMLGLAGLAGIALYAARRKFSPAR
jgi:hypothetical protein